MRLAMMNAAASAASMVSSNVIERVTRYKLRSELRDDSVA